MNACYKTNSTHETFASDQGWGEGARTHPCTTDAAKVFETFRTTSPRLPSSELVVNNQVGALGYNENGLRPMKYKPASAKGRP